MGRRFTDEIAARTQVVKDEAAHTWTEEMYWCPGVLVPWGPGVLEPLGD